MAHLTEDILTELRGYIRRDVRAGFLGVHDIVEGALEVVACEAIDADALRPHAEQMLAESLVELQEEAGSWPATTDCDRLDAAFQELEAEGIVARQNFSCCQTCGHAEIWEEIQQVSDAGRRVDGYTFFHQQDTESAVESGSMCLAYGALEEGEEATVTVGHRIANTLRSHGLSVAWDGSVKRRIQISLQWRKRLS